MRDIRSDLVDRLDMAKGRARELAATYEREAEALAQKYRHEATEIDRECDAIRAMLAIEDRREGLPPSTQAPTIRMSLPDFLVTAVQTHGPMTKDDLRIAVEAAGYFDGETTGRTLHTTLMNITKGGRLRQGLDGKYIASPMRPASFLGFQMEGDMLSTN